ncbi:MAG: 6-phosphogluconolactonase [Phototrophicaceae bacterium]|jgi:6-phosphogluconolactonase
MPQIMIRPTADALYTAAADLFLERYHKAANRFSVALAGGSTPLPVYCLLATPAYAAQVDWSRVHVFYGDERIVPIDHPDNNYRAIHEAFTSQVPIPAANLHRVAVELGVPNAGIAYGRHLKEFFDGGAPTFDLQYLGMGDDGHTLSLFPGDETAMNETHHRIVNVQDSLHPHPRVTLTAWAANASQVIAILVSGSKKAATLKAVLEGDYQPLQYPVQLIQPTSGDLRWLLDQDAAAALSP